MIGVPVNMTVPATGTNGAAVTFSTSATDDTDGPVATTNVPASGATFPHRNFHRYRLRAG